MKANEFNIWICATILFLFSAVIKTEAQSIFQYIKGTVVDVETYVPLSGANITVVGQNGQNGVTSDSTGRFRIFTSVGRVTVRVSYMGYEELVLSDVLVSTGKEVEITAELKELVFQAGEVVVSGRKSSTASLNTMATVSSNTLRAADALRFAGGYYDPSRMINTFAGVATANNDYSNELVIRGNTPRGLLWRIEGIEVPNPNHFSSGQGGSAGAYSAISSNSIESFGFYTGAFPAEFGNAIAGVIDVDLRKGNSEEGEYAFQTGMIGAEMAAEGPLSKKTGASYAVNARYINFDILNRLKLIDLEESNIAPQTLDIVSNLNLPLEKAGTLNLFCMYGTSHVGKSAEHNTALWEDETDNWEESETGSVLITGLKHLIPLKGKKTYIRTSLAFTSQTDSFSEGFLDSSYILTETYRYKYDYPSLRAAMLINHKVSPSASLRTGLSYDRLSGTMLNYKLLKSGKNDTLVNAVASTDMGQLYSQVKYKITGRMELMGGFHLLYFRLNNEFSFEPRIGLRWEISKSVSFIAGMGLHSRAEALSVYYTEIKGAGNIRTMENIDLGLMKSVQWVTGLDMALGKDITLRLEAYYQHLYNVPIINEPLSRYSILNSSQGLPESDLENAGFGRNKGIELTLDKSFTKSYYILFTASLFDSKYMPGDMQWHNTYYNSRYALNFLGGKDFHVGRNRQNIIGINAKLLSRGGYRYTPVDYEKSMLEKKIVTVSSQPYSESLPDFMRADAGISFRKNNNRSSWILMLDIQNITDRENVFRKRYVYTEQGVTSYYIYSLGVVPVFNFRVEF